MNDNILAALLKLNEIATTVANAGNIISLQLNPRDGFFSLSVEDEKTLLRAVSDEDSYDIPLDEKSLLTAAKWLSTILAEGVRGFDDHQLTEDFLDISLKGEIKEGTPIVFPNPGKSLMFSALPWADEP